MSNNFSTKVFREIDLGILKRPETEPFFVDSRIPGVQKNMDDIEKVAFAAHLKSTSLKIGSSEKYTFTGKFVAKGQTLK